MKNDYRGVQPWLLALHFLFSQYGDPGAWPLPDLAGRAEFLTRFPDYQEQNRLHDKHRAYLYNAWLRHFLKPETRKKRWGRDQSDCLAHTPKPCRLEPVFQYASADEKPKAPRYKAYDLAPQPEDQAIRAAVSQEEINSVLFEYNHFEYACFRISTCLRVNDNLSYRCNNLDSLESKALQHFNIDGDMIFIEGRNTFALNSLMGWTNMCFVWGLTSRGQDPADERMLNRWQKALLVLFNQYGDRGAWPLPNQALLNKFKTRFPDGRVWGEKQRAYLFDAWYEYLLEHQHEHKRSTWSDDQLYYLSHNEDLPEKGYVYFPEFQYRKPGAFKPNFESYEKLQRDYLIEVKKALEKQWGDDGSVTEDLKDASTPSPKTR